MAPPTLYLARDLHAKGAHDSYYTLHEIPDPSNESSDEVPINRGDYLTTFCPDLFHAVNTGIHLKPGAPPRRVQISIKEL